MTSRLTSDMMPDHPAATPAPSQDGKADTQAGAAQSGTPQAENPQADTPHVASPPTSPWWTAPGGKPVDIPAFGRTLLETILAWLLPTPRPVPAPVRVRR